MFMHKTALTFDQRCTKIMSVTNAEKSHTLKVCIFGQTTKQQLSNFEP